MKTKLLLSTLSTFVFCLLSSQVPQGFNYQAIARDGSGNPIVGATIQVKIGILSDTIAQTVVWEELHNPVKTNAFGLFGLVIGKGVRQSGSALFFNDINWSATPLYIKIQINQTGTFKYMGSAQLWSVPYSMIAGDLEGAVKKLEVIGDDTQSDEALFEVKRKDGATMFAVYNHGVRIYMPLDTLTKARKGGFAIGGFDKAKGVVQDYFIVNPDSIRAYIDTNPAKARKGGFAIGGFDKAKAGNEEYLRVTRDSTRIYLNDTGVKARKGGFAIGGFDGAKGGIQDFLTVSTDSIRMFIDDNPVKARKGGFAIGGFDKAKGGNASFLNVATDESGIIKPSQNRILWYPLKNAFLTGKVLIERPDSVGVNSFASGFESKAKGGWSQALGYQTIARGNYSTAIGKYALANNPNSFAFGNYAQALNESSFAFGAGAIASGINSYAFGSIGIDSVGNQTGQNTISSGNNSIAIGMGSQSTNLGAFSFGIGNLASGELSTALGYDAKATGISSIAIGTTNTASSDYSVVIGAYSSAGEYSEAIGDFVNARNGSTALGGWTKAYGHNSTAMGYQTVATGDYSTVMGLNSVSKGHASTAMGWGTVASGFFTTATGFYTKAKPYSSFVVGQYNDSTCSPTGSTSWVSSDPLFIAGNGLSSSSRSNAFTVYKDGNVYIQGNLGIGTTSPSAKLHISGNEYVEGNIGIGTVSPVSKLDIAGGNWDLVNGNGDIRVGNDSYRLKIGVATGGGGAGASGIMQFGQTGGYNVLSLGAQGSYQLFINGSTQRVGIGTDNPGYKLTVNGAAWCSTGAWTGSDIRWKKNITELDNTLSGIMNLRAVNYDLRTDEFPLMGFESGSQIGLIAQDVEKVFPLLVNTDNNGFKAVAYDKLSVVLVEAVKEQQLQIESLNEKIARLEKMVEEMQVVMSRSGEK